MKSIADALVYAVAYIDCREDEAKDYLDDDVSALESIASLLTDATDDELNALAAAAKRALELEQAAPSLHDRSLEDYSSWMEYMFGEGSVGNDRAR